MASIIEKRISLHKNAEIQQRQIEALQAQIAQLQALANIGTTTSIIAHEINNLLTPIANYAVLAMKNLDDKPLTKKALNKIAKNSERAVKTMESILAVAKGKGRVKEDVLLLPLVEEIFTCLCRDFAKDRITVKIDIPDDLTAWCISIQIQQLLMNLILNARYAMLTSGGILSITATDTVDTVIIEVQDTGSGIEPDDLEHIFEPFFTTKNNNGPHSEAAGCGLGLPFCKSVTEAHDGSISVESKPKVGTKFVIKLPKS